MVYATGLQTTGSWSRGKLLDYISLVIYSPVPYPITGSWSRGKLLDYISLVINSPVHYPITGSWSRGKLLDYISLVINSTVPYPIPDPVNYCLSKYFALKLISIKRLSIIIFDPLAAFDLPQNRSIYWWGGGVNQHLESGNRGPKNLESGN